MVDSTTKWRRRAGAAGLIAAGAVAGAIIANALTATAGEDGSGSAGSVATASWDHWQRGDEQLLTGDTKDRVEAAVLAEYPGATIVRTETDSGGVYESHIVTADGRELIVLVDEDFSFTGTQDDRHHGGRGRHD